MCSYFNRILSVKDAKKKMCITLAVFFSYLLQGWSEQQMGVALPTLERLVGVDQELFSLTIVVWNGGCITGSLTSGFLFDKFNRLRLMAIFTIGLAVTTLLLPYCRTLWVMLVCRFFIGAFNSASDTGANTIIPTVWQNECGPFIHILYVCFAVGGILSPFATLPFVSASNNTTAIWARMTKDGHYSKEHNSSEIHFAFFISAALYVICAVPYIVMQCVGNFEILTTTKKTDTYELFTDINSPGEDNVSAEHKSHTDNDNLGSYRTIAIICLLCGIHAIFIAVEESLTVYLVTFCLDLLHWNDTDSATLASVYWITSCVAGILGLVIVALLSSSTILCLSLILTNVSIGTVLIGYYVQHSWMIWLGIMSTGFSMIMVVPSVFTWSQKYVCEISGKVSYLFIVTAGICAALSAYLVSYMMSHLSKITYIYLMLSGAALCQMFYILAFCLRFGCLQRNINFCPKVFLSERTRLIKK